MTNFTPQEGHLFINGEEQEIFKFKKVVGFVPQDDIMLRELTVKENIAFSANIRLPRWDKAKIRAHVSSVIKALGLKDVENSIIGDESQRLRISGGQRKRVNIGLELAACPIALFLDEPTSGLDATAALQVTNILKSLSRLGMTVVAVVHQPRYEIFSTFDDILLLTPSGNTAYMGPISKVEDYFSNLGYKFELKQNPADILVDIVSGKIGEHLDLYHKWKNHINNECNTDQKIEVIVTDHNTKKNHCSGECTSNQKNHNCKTEQCSDQQNLDIEMNQLKCQGVTRCCDYEEETRKRGASFLKQFILNHNRYILQQYRTVNHLILEISVASSAGFLMGLAMIRRAGNFYQGILIEPYTLISPSPIEFIVPQLGLLIGLAVGIASAPAGVKIFGEEKLVFWRESAAGHNRLAYYLGKTIASIYRVILSALHFTTFYHILGSPLISFDRLYLLLFMMIFCVYGLSVVVSMLVRRENSALLAVIVTMFAAVFNGYGPTLTQARDMQISFIWDLSYGRWASEALFSEETHSFKHLFKIQSSASFWGYTLDRFWTDFSIMFTLGIIYRIIAFSLLILFNMQPQKHWIFEELKIFISHLKK